MYIISDPNGHPAVAILLPLRFQNPFEHAECLELMDALSAVYREWKTKGARDE